MPTITFKNLINVLIHLAEADNHFAKEEHELILKIIRDKGLEESFYSDMEKTPLPFESLTTLPIEIKFEYLFSSIELIFADRNVYYSEILFCKKIASRLGFKPSLIDYYITHYNQQSHDELKSVTLAKYR